MVFWQGAAFGAFHVLHVISCPRRAKQLSEGWAAGKRSVAESSHHVRSCTTVASFVDTNILIYAEDCDAKAKYETARQLILRLGDERDR
jgi:hypothetical protein